MEQSCTIGEGMASIDDAEDVRPRARRPTPLSKGLILMLIMVSGDDKVAIVTTSKDVPFLVSIDAAEPILVVMLIVIKHGHIISFFDDVLAVTGAHLSAVLEGMETFIAHEVFKDVFPISINIVIEDGILDLPAPRVS